jgi:hypothetical protein
MARKHFVSATEAASTISTIGKGALDTLASQGCMTEITTCENSRAKLLVVIRDSQEVKYKLRVDATADQHYLFHAAWEISQLMRHQDDPDFLARCTSFFAGLQTGMYLALTGNTLNNALLKQFNETHSARRKGGAATAKWTPKIDKYARELLGELPVSVRANEDLAAKRIAPKVGVSISSVKRHLFNAER